MGRASLEHRLKFWPVLPIPPVCEGEMPRSEGDEIMQHVVALAVFVGLFLGPCFLANAFSGAGLRDQSNEEHGERAE